MASAPKIPPPLPERRGKRHTHAHTDAPLQLGDANISPVDVEAMLGTRGNSAGYCELDFDADEGGDGGYAEIGVNPPSSSSYLSLPLLSLTTPMTLPCARCGFFLSPVVFSGAYSPSAASVQSCTQA